MEPRATDGPALDPEAREGAGHDAIRNASVLILQRGLDVLRSLAFAALVPRLLGPADFGRFALLSSIAYWFAVMSGLGSTQLMGRFVPEMVLRGERSAARRLLGNLLALRALSGVVAAVLYFVLMAAWLRDLPFVLLAAMAAGVALRSVAQVPFAFFLGLDQAARWGVGEVVRRWSSLLLVVAGTLVLGVRGACLGIALAEICVLALGLRWTRPHLSAAAVRLEREFIAPYLRYNLAFLGSNLLFALCQRGGEALLRAAHADYAEVGYFSVAAAAYLAATQGMWQFLLAFLPSLTRLLAQGRHDMALQWAGRLLKVLAAGAVVAWFGAALLGPDLVPILVGPAFRPAVPLLVVIGIAVLADAVGTVGRLLALALDRPRLALAAAVARASALLALGFPLAVRFGAFGAAMAVAAAAILHAGVFLWLMPREALLALRRSLAVVALGSVFLPLAVLPVDGAMTRVALFVAFLAGYAAALRVTRLVTGQELSTLRHALRYGGLA